MVAAAHLVGCCVSCVVSCVCWWDWLFSHGRTNSQTPNKKGHKYRPEYYLGAHNFPENTPIPIFWWGVQIPLCWHIISFMEILLWSYFKINIVGTIKMILYLSYYCVRIVSTLNSNSAALLYQIHHVQEDQAVHTIISCALFCNSFIAETKYCSSPTTMRWEVIWGSISEVDLKLKHSPAFSWWGCGLCRDWRMMLLLHEA